MAIRSRLTGSGTGSLSYAVTLPGDAAVGDRVLVGFANDHAHTTASGSTGWTDLGEENQGTTTNHSLSVFSRVLDGGANDSLTVTLTDSDSHTELDVEWVVICLTSNGGTPSIVFNDGGGATSGTVGSITSLPSDDYDSIIFLALDNSTAAAHTVTPPTNWANLTHDFTSSDVIGCWSMDNSDEAVTGFTPGNVTWTNTEQWITGHVVVAAINATPIAATDSGTGTDTVTSILRAADLTDTGTGTDDLGVTVLAPNLTDSGLGTDAIQIDAFTPIDLTDSGTGTDGITVDKTDLIALTDSGTGTDTASGFATTDLTDSGAGVDDLSGLNRFLTDSGVGSDAITVLNIPFTQVLPPSRLGNLYDLVVMARVPQQSSAPLFLDVDPIEWTQLSYTNELSAPSELQAGCQISSLTPVLIERFRNLATNPVELWLYRNGRLVFSGPLRGGQVNGEQLTLTAKGVLDYLKHMFVTQDLTYKTVDQHTIVKNLVDHWQNLDYGNFGIDTSSISASGVTRDVTYLKNELHNIAQRVEDLSKAAQGFDLEVDPETRALLLWHPTKGLDRSTGEDAVVFDSRNITSSSVMFSASVTDIATEAFGTGTAAVGDGPKYSSASNTELRSKYGRTGVTGTWSEVADQTSLDNHVQALVDARTEALVVPGPEARETPDSDITTYSVGDTILYQPNELLMVSAPFRIRKQTVRVAGSGRETVSLEFA